METNLKNAKRIKEYEAMLSKKQNIKDFELNDGFQKVELNNGDKFMLQLPLCGDSFIEFKRKCDEYYYSLDEFNDEESEILGTLVGLIEKEIDNKFDCQTSARLSYEVGHFLSENDYVWLENGQNAYYILESGKVFHESKHADYYNKEMYTETDNYLKKVNFFKADFSDKDLSNVNFSGLNLSEANFSNANLSNANFSNANLSGACFFEAELFEIDLSCANLKDSYVSYSDLFKADLSNADLSGADLSDSNFTGANLSDSKLLGANLKNSDLTGANLSRSDLSNADLSNADFSGTDFSGADLTGADLTGADFSKTNLFCAFLKNTKSNNIS